MAIDQLPNATDTVEDDENTESEKSKRERVDLEALPADARVQLSITVPAGLKLALIKAGEPNALAASAFARNVLAERMEYSIPAVFNERTRASKYASPEDAKAAQKAKQQERANLTKLLMAAVKEGRININDL